MYTKRISMASTYSYNGKAHSTGTDVIEVRLNGVKPEWALKWALEDIVADYMAGLNMTKVVEFWVV